MQKISWSWGKISVLIKYMLYLNCKYFYSVDSNGNKYHVYIKTHASPNNIIKKIDRFTIQSMSVYIRG